MKTKNLLIVLMLTILVGCSKEEELTNTQMISSDGGKEWITSGMVRDTTDIFDKMSSCETDDIYKFYTDHNFEYSEGDTSCFPGDTTIVYGSWYMNDVQTLLQIAIGSDTTEYIIKELEKGKISLFFIEQESGSQFLWTLKPR